MTTAARLQIREVDLRLLPLLAGPGEGLIEGSPRLLQLAGADRPLATALQFLEASRHLTRFFSLLMTRLLSRAGFVRGPPGCV